MEKKKFAFTLSEALITILIIGIVAALTIPSIIKNYQEKELAAKYKKFYSTMLQVNAKAVQDFGPMKTWRFSWGTILFEKYLQPYLRVAKKCAEYPSKTCGRYNGLFNITAPIVILEDGTTVSYWGYPTDESCINYFVCGGAYIDVDLNGEKGPNKQGLDLHRFSYTIGTERFSGDKTLLQK